MGPSAYERRHDIAAYCRDTEIWSLNNAYLTFPTLRRDKAFTRFFEMHSWHYLQTWKAGEGVDHWAHLKDIGCPVFVGNPLPAIEDAIQIDWDGFARHWKDTLYCNLEMVTDLSTVGMAVYFRGSPSLMLALALWEHDQGGTIDYIQSWGIDTSDPQHQCQRPSWSFWIGQALARGIKIGGTMANFMLAPEDDKGLDGLSQLLTDKAAKPAQKKGKTP